ncbi:FHA domain-containing protein [Luteimonas sp. MC1572]|uniref:FHA domain-containing protein n=1 Tax=Luteimonas sp. MC1572 TaxID=2799325 RepID=UPI0018F0E358|nr:FHA domain-containing protein [Luteimonas sp. MC1572]MBJ6982612.1 FHA domain-containing protein [Luteimonas sp. MC1572]QQO03859.1 FHA domain-containing protein [Luteimonas sp. MC1572]
MSPTSLAIATGDGDSTLATVVRPALPRFVLRGVGGAGFGRTFALVGPTVLGRAPDCGIHLDHPGVSRQHVRLTPTSEGLLVEDLGSTNGWLLNEVVQQRAWARHGDELGFDVLRFRVVAPGAVGAQPAPLRKTPSKTSAWPWMAVFAVLGAVAALVLLLR